MPLENISQNDPTLGSNHLSTAELQGPPASAQAEIQPVKTHCGTTRRTEKDWWDKTKPFIEIGGILLLAVYTGFTIAIYRASSRAADAAHDTVAQVQQQTSLMVEQLVGTLSAIVEFRQPYWDDEHSDRMVVRVNNVGHMISPNVKANFTVTRLTFPRLQQIGNPQNFYEMIPQLPPNEWTKSYDVIRPATEISLQRDTVRVEGAVNFDNGFGTRISQTPFCFMYIGRGNVQTAIPGVQSQYIGQFMDCRLLEGRLNYILAHLTK
ncbi:MAG: hypothetical protein WAN65_32810 [Candidatus Sulfotelmatobacter sp.]